MNKLTFTGTILLLLVFSNCKNPLAEANDSKNPLSERDTIKSKHFSDVLKDDSIKLLDYKKYKTEYSDEVESIKYIDYKKNNNDKNRLKNLSLDSLIRIAQKLNTSTESTPKVSLTNECPEILGMYLPTEKYSNEYCMYYFDIEFFDCLTDSLLISNDMEGVIGYYYSNIKKDGNIITIDIVENPYLNKVEIKLLGDKNNASIWRFTSKGDENSYTYRLFIPISTATNVPILYTLTPGELDDVYDGFDKISLEEIFNK